MTYIQAFQALLAEVLPVSSRDAETTMQAMRVVCELNGVPETIVSDNAAEFDYAKLLEWLKQIGCRMIKTPHYHPQSNGQAEITLAHLQ